MQVKTIIEVTSSILNTICSGIKLTIKKLGKNNFRIAMLLDKTVGNC